MLKVNASHFSIELFWGPMRSGKSERLLKAIETARLQHLPALLFQPAWDTRSGKGRVKSRAGGSEPAIRINDPMEILKYIDKAMVFGIDEAQFFDSSIVKVVQTLASRGKRVIIAGMNLDYTGNPMGFMAQLSAMAEHSEKCFAICEKCGSPEATRTQLLTPLATSQMGEHQYEPRCLTCFDPPALYRPLPMNKGKKLFSDPGGPLAEILVREGLFNDGDAIAAINAELIDATKALAGVDDAIAVYGSARVKPDSKEYEEAYGLVSKIVAASPGERKLGIITGGGPGIMEAANKAAAEQGAASIGVCIRMAHEQATNRFVNLETVHRFFSTRKFVQRRKAKAFIGFPGSFGTMDEICEVVCLCKTNNYCQFEGGGKAMTAPPPVYLIGKNFWPGFIDWAKESMIPGGYATEEEIDIMRIVDPNNEDETAQMIKEIHQLQARPRYLSIGAVNTAAYTGMRGTL